ncbi:MAG: FG-GAP-like repeat-containing protein, partial [bacterium]
AVGDLDGDGDLDVVGAAFMPQVDPATWKNWDSLVWAENQGNARKWQVRTLEVGNPVHSAVLIEDVDQDGAADIILGNYVWLRSDSTPSARRDYLTVWRRRR